MGGNHAMGGGFRGGLSPSANHALPGGSRLPWDGVVNPPFGINSFGPSHTGNNGAGFSVPHGYGGMHGYGGGGREPYRGGREHHGYGHHGYGRDFGSFLNGAYLVPGWIGPGLWGYPDLVDEAQNGDPSPDQYAAYPSGPAPQDRAYPDQRNSDEGYADRESTRSPEGSGNTPEPWPMRAPRAPYHAQESSQPQPAPEPPANRPALTLIFWDLRPNQEVHDYLVTPKTLYVFDGGRRREIPLVDVDVVATAQLNRENGVEFGVPIGGK